MVLDGMKKSINRINNNILKGEKMKKYFMSESGEEVEFGDTIEVELECEFTDDEECINSLLELGIIEEKEVDDDLIDFDGETCEALQEFMGTQSKTDKKIDAVVDSTTLLIETVTKLVDAFAKSQGKTEPAKMAKKK